jgi:hypothetical protein
MVYRKLALLLPLLLAGPAAAAATAEDPDWPCQQRLVPEIAAAMIWAGPPLDQVEAEASPATERLAAELAARRVPLADAEAQVEAYAASLAAERRDAQLTRLFADTLAQINRDRTSIIQGIRKFAHNQQALAERITANGEQLGALGAGQIAERDALMAARQWDLRLYEDRRSSLTYLCEQPVLLEQRAFALARAIAAHLE